MLALCVVKHNIMNQLLAFYNLTLAQSMFSLTGLCVNT